MCKGLCRNLWKDELSSLPDMTRSNYVKHESKAKDFSLAVFADILNITKGTGNRTTFKAQGSSMSPFIKSGDVLTVAPNNFNPSIGTVVAYIDNNRKKVLMHRVIGKQKDKYILKGDNCKFIDGIMSKDSFAGYVESIQRKGELIRLGFGKEKILIALLSRSGLLFYALCFLRRIKQYIRKFIND